MVKTTSKSWEISSPNSFKTSECCRTEGHTPFKMSIMLIFSARGPLKLSPHQKNVLSSLSFQTLSATPSDFFPEMKKLSDHFCHFYVFKEFDYFITAQETHIIVNILFTPNTLILISMPYFQCHSFLPCILLMILAIFWQLWLQAYGATCWNIHLSFPDVLSFSSLACTSKCQHWLQ